MKKNSEIRSITMERFKEVRWKLLGTFIVIMIVATLGMIIPILNVFISLILPMGLLATIIGMYNGNTEEKMSSVWGHGIDYLKNWFCGSLWIFLRMLIPFIVFMVGYVLLLVGMFSSTFSMPGMSPSSSSFSGGPILTIFGAVLIIVGYVFLITIGIKYGLFSYVLLHSEQSERARDIVKRTGDMIDGHKWQYFCMMFYYTFLMWAIGFIAEFVSKSINVGIVTIVLMLCYYIIDVLFVLEMMCSLEEFYKELAKEKGIGQEPKLDEFGNEIKPRPYDELLG